MRILIIEDEPKTAGYLSKGLRENGFITDHAANGEDGLFLATYHDYDLLIVDVMLPKLDGYTLVTALRRLKPAIRILFLTACDSLEDKVKGLELGADDYMIKPFAFSELLARIRSLFRREIGLSKNQVTIADLHIDLLKHRAIRGTAKLDLTSKEFSLLVLLAQRCGEVLSRTLIAELVWDINFDSNTNVIDVAIRRLRQKVDDPFPQKLIHTIRGMGYTLDER